MNVVYTLIETPETDQYGHPYTGYGIALDTISGTEQPPLPSVPDLFLDKTQAEDFVRLCNEQEVEPCHLMEIIDNILA